MPIRGRKEGPGSAGRSKRKASGSRMLTAVELQKLSPSMRLLLLVLDDKNWCQFAWRTGQVVDAKNAGRALPLPVVFRIARKKAGILATDIHALHTFLTGPGVFFSLYWLAEFIANKALDRFPIQLQVDARDPSLMADGEPVRDRLGKILDTGFVTEIALAVPHSPLLGTSIGDIGMPANATYKGRKLTGKGVVIGIIDDGCPFAHQDFLVNAGTAAAPVYRARTARIWDQATDWTANAATKGWKQGPNYGREITAAEIEKAINAPVNPVKPHIAPQGWVEEDTVYDYLQYPMGSAGKPASHGARVMGIAAGNGRAAMARPGIAPEAEVIFVQVPPMLLDVVPGQLSHHILDGLSYIFGHAKAARKPAVVNISLGGNTHAHDGTSPWEYAMDQLLVEADRSIVVSAGNGFEADCHVSGTVPANKTVSQDWWIKAEDPTPNDLELWYDNTRQIEVSLVAPEGTTLGPYKIGTSQPIVRGGTTIGYIDHNVNLNGDCCALIWMFETGAPLPGLPPPPTTGAGPAPAGKWILKIRNTGGRPINYHAWIQRDDVGAPGGRRQQSRFDPEAADPRHTICDLASGRLTISVGAHNAATQEIGRYSAAGPTRPVGAAAGRDKPDVLAPGEAAPNGRGVLATASARAQPTRIGGTSASAPHVAGIVALILEYAKFKGVTLTAAQIRAAIRASGTKAGLKPNRHQIADRYPKIKQAAVWNDVVGTGKVDLERALRFLFP